MFYFRSIFYVKGTSHGKKISFNSVITWLRITLSGCGLNTEHWFIMEGISCGKRVQGCIKNGFFCQGTYTEVKEMILYKNNYLEFLEAEDLFKLWKLVEAKILVAWWFAWQVCPWVWDKVSCISYARGGVVSCLGFWAKYKYCSICC